MARRHDGNVERVMVYWYKLTCGGIIPMLHCKPDGPFKCPCHGKEVTAQLTSLANKPGHLSK